MLQSFGVTFNQSAETIDVSHFSRFVLSNAAVKTVRFQVDVILFTSMKTNTQTFEMRITV